MVLAPCALRPLADVRPRGPQDATQVDTLVVFEPLVLERDDGLPQVRRDARQRHFDAIFPENRENRTLIDVVQRRRLRHFAESSKLVATRQARKQDNHHHSDGNRDSAERRENDSLVPNEMRFDVG